MVNNYDDGPWTSHDRVVFTVMIISVLVFLAVFFPVMLNDKSCLERATTHEMIDACPLPHPKVTSDMLKVDRGTLHERFMKTFDTGED